MNAFMRHCDQYMTEEQFRNYVPTSALITTSYSPPNHTETSPQAFGVPLSHVIANDRVHKLRHEHQHDHQREEQSNATELMLSFLHLSPGFKRPNKELSSSNSSLSSTPESHNDSPLPSMPDIASRTSRRVSLSVSKTDSPM